MGKAKILILVPSPSARGGISNYYQVLKGEFGEEVEYFERGARNWPHHDTKLQEAARFCRDYLRFLMRVVRRDVSLVQSTTSLSLSTTIRDGIFLKCARMFGCKTIVFFRGWDYHAEEAIKSRLGLFRFFFGSSDAMIVLTERSRATLKQWGFSQKIYLETTLVDRGLIRDVDDLSVKAKYATLAVDKTINLLYLSRIEKRKGIFDLVRAFMMLCAGKDLSHRFRLRICGDGLAEEDLRVELENLDPEMIQWSGHVTGPQKIEAYQEAHIFVFPSHGEGMPNAVLEAMGFGLPVVCTPVGALVDFFEDSVHGRIVPVGDVQAIHDSILDLSSDHLRLTGMAINNHMYAVQRFRSDKVCKRIKKIFQEVMR